MEDPSQPLILWEIVAALASLKQVCYFCGVCHFNSPGLGVYMVRRVESQGR
jgi:hypothetical protein